MKNKVLILIPPFTQLNTPYPSTPYLKGFLNSIDVDSQQVDLGIETILELFSSSGLNMVFDEISSQQIASVSENSARIIELKAEYIKTIDHVISFLQNRCPSLANIICNGTYLPQAGRFEQANDLEWAFGIMGTHDKARHLATLYLEDLGDLIKETIDPHFGFSRYAEHLGRYANEFDELDNELKKPESLINKILLQLLKNKINEYNPDLLAISVPFPGNLFSGLRCASFVKTNYPEIKIAMGGGFVSTELRSLNDARVFKYLDFVCLDDGELPLNCIIEHIRNKRDIQHLKRTFVLNDGNIAFINGAPEKDFDQSPDILPDYHDLLLDRYLSVIEIANPMHSLWSNGRWNKLMLAHGCYWAKCSFCDTSLDYIQRFVPSKAKILVDKIEAIIAQTGEIGFHFVDEAAPPSMLRELAIELLRRKLTIVWWTNIRFEKNFTSDLCRLLAVSGCIAVSGGLEVASDRLLKLINKGVDIEQVAKSANNFTSAGIMVHAYLMYGFPTQTDQETIDSLEVVRQLFDAGIVQSGFWHRFALTVHSPVAQNPDFFKIRISNNTSGNFANNDLDYKEMTMTNHEKYSKGLRISLYNYMHGVGFELRLNHWFDFDVSATRVKKGLIEEIINSFDDHLADMGRRLLWIGFPPRSFLYSKNKKGKEIEMIELKFTSMTGSFNLKLEKKIAEFLVSLLPKIALEKSEKMTVREMKEAFENEVGEGFLLFFHGKSMEILRKNGLFVL